jgi:hypothetical protein
MDSKVLIDDLENDLHIVESLLKGVTQAEAQAKPDSEGWSILETLGHLCDEESDDFCMLLELILYHPNQPWPEPHIRQVFIERQYNTHNLSELLEKFSAERRKNLAWLRSLTDPDWNAVYTSEFGQMKAGDMLAAWAAHDILHLRQLVELRWNRVVTAAQPFDVRYAGEW